MNKDINLINQETQKNLLYLRFRNKIQKIAFFLSIFFIVLSLLVLIFYIYSGNDLKKKGEKTAVLKTEINKLSKNESYLFTINNRIGGVRKTLENQKKISKVVSNLIVLYESGFIYETLEISSSGTLELSGTCDNNQILSNVVNQIEKIKNDGLFSSIAYSKVTGSVNGKYILTLDVKI